MEYIEPTEPVGESDWEVLKVKRMTTKEEVITRLIELTLVLDQQEGNRWMLTEIESLGKTPEELIKEDRTDLVLNYIERIEGGGYA